MTTPCPFEKVILAGRCGCAHAERYAVGERLGVVCISPVAHHNCRTLLALLRDRARFALKAPSAAVPWPFGKEMRVMLGGLAGLKRLLASEKECGQEAGLAPPRTQQEPDIENIHALVRRAQEAYGALEALPFRELVRSIARRRPRHCRQGDPPTP